MLFKFFISFLFLAAAIAAPTSDGDAPVAAPLAAGNNKIYCAHFNASGSLVSGTIKFSSSPAGNGVVVDTNLAIADSALGPFAYHIHNDRVPADGNCTATGGHFDPFKSTIPRLPCDSGNPKACEVGDLSGKHARIPQYPNGSIQVHSEHNDQYISLDPGNIAFIGNRSIVVHNSIANARIACANLEVRVA